MRAPLLVLILATACAGRDVPEDGSTGQTADTTSAVDPATSTDPTTPTPTDPTSPDPTTGAPDNPPGFCSPVAQDDQTCPAESICCSDDPATTNGRLPNYFNGKLDEVYGIPIFSGTNNELSFSGQCMEVGVFPSPFASGCPVPCDPTWSVADRDQICGPGSVCCPLRQVDPQKDCVLDPMTDRWRAVHGTDIGTLTTWGNAHTTNQDPLGASCALFSAGDTAALADCYTQLTVADRRGFCVADCPCYEDLCDMKNPGWVPRCG